jgi:predicted amidohydrolase
LKIAIAQLNPTVGDLNGNAQNILSTVQTAAKLQANLVLTPELSLCGYPPRDLLMYPQFIEEMAITLTQLAANLPPHLSVLVGTVWSNTRSSQTGGKLLHNSMALLAGGTIKQIFHKRLLPTYDVFDEDRYFEPGEYSQSFLLSVPHQWEGNGVHQSGTEARFVKTSGMMKNFGDSPPTPATRWLNWQSRGLM